jgi:hypothetical protein
MKYYFAGIREKKGSSLIPVKYFMDGPGNVRKCNASHRAIDFMQDDMYVQIVPLRLEKGCVWSENGRCR